VRVITGQDSGVADWVARQIPIMAAKVAREPFGKAFGPSTAIGVINEEGWLIGGVVYHGYDPDFRSIELSFASATSKWLTRPIIAELLGYPFYQLGCQRVTGATPKKAADARRFLEKFGFKREGVIRRGFGSDDAILSGLLRREWEQSRYFRPPSQVLVAAA
jgi:RimJ/RimL family protein N-acetyltransferase